MRLDATTVTIEPRSLGACLDLALLFYRHHARPVLKLTLAFGLPGVALTALLVARLPDSGWLWAAAWLLASSSLLGAAIVAGAGRAVFGDPFEARPALRALGARTVFALLAERLVVGLLTVFCLGVPGLLLHVYYGFLPEVLVLEELHGRAARRRLGELAGPIYLSLLWRHTLLLVFLFGGTLAVFMVADQLLGLLGGRPLLGGRFDPRFLGADLALFLADAWTMSLLVASAWLVYPLTRLAWFFCYLDARIRREGWDLELLFRVEARRLEAPA